MKKLNLLFIILSVSVSNLFSQNKVFDITDFGASTSKNFLNTEPIQAAIDVAYNNEGGTVVIPAGTFLSGTIVLKDNVELHLDRGAILLGSPQTKDYPRQAQPEYRSLKDDGGFYSLIYAEGAKNIAITGNGTIDGQGAYHKGRPDAPAGDRDGRPRNILLISCNKIEVSGITLRNSGMWSQHYLNCEDLIVDNIRVYNHCNRNNDGIDIDGCRKVILSNSIFDTDDDAICLKSTGPAPCEDILINNCIASSFCNGIKMGTESTGGFRNINISNCLVKPSVHPEAPSGNKFSIGITGLSLEIVDGGVMEGVSVNNLTIEGTMCPVYVRLGGRNRKHKPDAPEPTDGRMSNILINNITAYGCGNFTCSVTGIPGHKVENVKLSNFNILHQGGVKQGDYLADFDDVKEDVKGYPQPTSWGNLPVSGLFVRHVDGITVDNFSVDASVPDPRPIFMLHDVNNIKIQDILVGKNCNNDELYVLKEVTNHTLETINIE